MSRHIPMTPADPGACGTCRARAAAGEQLDHQGCASRARLLPAPGTPTYEDLGDVPEEQRRKLPARFHIPVWDGEGRPNAWLCAVCWGDGWVTQWPCQTAQEHGGAVFTQEHLTEREQQEREAEVARLRVAMVARDRRDDELRAVLAKWEIPPGDAGADLWALGMAVLSHLDSPIYRDDWDPDDRVGALRELTEQLTDALAGAHRTVAEQQDAMSAARPPARHTPTRDAVWAHVHPDDLVDPVSLRWGLDDVLWGDDDTVALLLSDEDLEPYVLELEPEQAAAMRNALAGPAGDRAALAPGLRAAADEIAGIDFHPAAVVRSLTVAEGLVRRLRRLADEADTAGGEGRG